MKTSIPTIESLIEIIEAQSALIKQLEARIHELARDRARDDVESYEK